MKKGILLLLFIPLVSFGQTYEVETTYDPFSNSSKSTVKRQDNNSPYGTNKYRPDIKSFTPDYNSLNHVLRKKESGYKSSTKIQRVINYDAKIDEYSKSAHNKERLKDYHGAIEDYNFAIDYLYYKSKMEGIKSTAHAIYAPIIWRRGKAKALIEDYRGAIEDYTSSLDMGSAIFGTNSSYIKSASDIYNDRGYSKRQLENYNGAKADYTKAIELNPYHPNAYFNRGVVNDKLKDYYGAIADYTKVIERGATMDRFYGYHFRGISKVMVKNENGAMADFNKAIELGGPDVAAAYFWRGVRKELLGDLNGACKDFRKAASLGYSLITEWATFVKNKCN